MAWFPRGWLDLVVRPPLIAFGARPHRPALPRPGRLAQAACVDARPREIALHLDDIVEPRHRRGPLVRRCSEGAGAGDVDAARRVEIAHVIGAILVDVPVQAEAHTRLLQVAEEDVVLDLLVASDRVVPYGDAQERGLVAHPAFVAGAAHLLIGGDEVTRSDPLLIQASARQPESPRKHGVNRPRFLPTPLSGARASASAISAASDFSNAAS